MFSDMSLQVNKLLSTAKVFEINTVTSFKEGIIAAKDVTVKENVIVGEEDYEQKLTAATATPNSTGET